MKFFSICLSILYVFIIYTLICGNFRFHRRGLIGRVYRFLTIDILNLFGKFLNYIKPKKMAEITLYSCLGTHGYFRYAIFIFFLAIYAYFYYEYHIACEPILKYFFSHPYLQKWLMYVVLPWPWIFFLILLFSDPGEITKENVNYYLKKYPPDNFLYFPDRVCPTLNIPLVPRSRYCKYTQKRIAKYDHYCPWVLTPIGEKNKRFFLFFLLSSIISSGYYCFGYTSYIIWRMKMIYNTYFSDFYEFDSKFRIFKETVSTLFYDSSSIIGCSIGLFLIAVVLSFFLFSQIFQVSRNILTIEQEKIQEIIEEKRKNGSEINYHNIYDKGFLQNWKECLFP